jgi:NAD(P)-dependent dehydrogenase (short-subunit alcohol dehydrogenase family)
VGRRAGRGLLCGVEGCFGRYTEALRHEVWHCGIAVTLVEPDAFVTNVLRTASTARAAIADYDGLRESVHHTLRESLQGGGDPRDVAEVILKIIRARSPRPRDGVGGGALWVPPAKTLLPGRLFDRLLRRGYGLPR